MKNFFTKQGAVLFSLLFLAGIIFQPSVANATTSFATQLYTFDLSGQSNITKLHIDLIAYATASAGNGIVAKIWNNNSSAWETLTSLGNTASSMPGSSSSQEITSNISNYLDGSNKVNLLVSSLNPSVGGTEAVLYTDYVNLTATTSPVVSSINPTTASNTNQTVSGIALTGQNFVAGAVVTFKKTGQTDIPCTSVSVSSATSITCNANFRGSVVGTWDIVVTNSDSTTGTLSNGLTITEATHPQFTSVGSNTARGSINMVTSGARTPETPWNNVAPVVTGTATVGQTLSCSTGTWYGTSTITYTYQWQHTTTNIGGATSSTYVIESAYGGEIIRCVVTATNSFASASANSNNSGSVVAVVPGAPTIGTATQTGATTATVAFTAPASNGGATITTYTAYPSSGSGSGTLSQAGSGTITVTGLTGSTSYTFTVKATNSVGQSPASSASNSITTPSPCSSTTITFTYNGGSVTYGTVIGADSKCWMDRNLGATQVATSATDSASYGHLFQWGRDDDGHQVTTSGTSVTQADVPGNNLFIKGFYDWRVTPSGTLWANSSSANNPCPASWHVPLQTEWASWVTAASVTNSATAYSSTLKLPLAGFRDLSNAILYSQSSYGYYWSSSPNGTSAYDLNFGSGGVSPTGNDMRAYGFSVRCVKD